MIKGSFCSNSVFEMPWWLDIVAPGKWHEAVLKEGDDVIARLPYVFDHGVVTNPLYTQTLGIWMAKSILEEQKGNSHLHRQKEVMFEICKQLPKCKSIMLYLDSSNDYVLPFRWLGYRIEPTFSYRINGIENIESVREKYGKTVIKNIKAAKRRIVIDEDSKEYESLVELQDMTYKRQGRSNPIRGDFSIEVMKKASENGNGKLLIARDEEGIPHSAGFFLFDDRTCYYLLGGQNPEFKSDGSQNLLLDAAISFAGTVSQNFDFEGSMVEGIENFFRQFGGNQIVNYHVSKQRIIPDLYEVLKPRIKRIIGFKI